MLGDPNEPTQIIWMWTDLCIPLLRFSKQDLSLAPRGCIDYVKTKYAVRAVISVSAFLSYAFSNLSIKPPPKSLLHKNVKIQFKHI